MNSVQYTRRQRPNTASYLRRQRLEQRLQRSAPATASDNGDALSQVMRDLYASFSELSGSRTTLSGAHLLVDKVSFQPPGSPVQLLNDISFSLLPNKLGIIYGRSGAGKTTLLHIISGLATQTSGDVRFSANVRPLSSQQRMQSAGLVFQFPERHFVGRTIAQEITVGWPLTPEKEMERQALSARAYTVLSAVGLEKTPLDTPLAKLSDGYKRRVALALQLIRRPGLLLLDEPLAGLDWKTRAEVVSLLEQLKQECTLLVVSHDLREMAPLVDESWCMQPGGKLQAAKLHSREPLHD